MNQLLKIIFSEICLIIIFTSLLNSTYSDKTFLVTREHIFNLPIEQTGWHDFINKKKYNRSIEFSSFYQTSVNHEDLAKYFGFNWGGTRGIENQIGVSTTLNTRLFRPREIIHDYNESISENNRMSANYNFKPYQERYGIIFNYYQDLDSISKKLYLNVNAPLINVKTHLNLHSLVSDISQELPDIPGSAVSLIDYLSGNVENVISNNNRQETLKYAKFNDNSRSSSGIADIDIKIGYKSLFKKYIKTRFNLSLLIPTGKRPDGEFIFEAIHGNRKHWAIGSGFNINLNIKEDGSNLINLLIVGNYKYLLKGKEKRTLDFIEPNPNQTTKEKAGYYKLASEQGGTKLFPFANISTQNINVIPGHIFETISNLAFIFKNFIVDLGYNFFIKSSESISLKYPWVDNKYAIADLQYNTENEFTTFVDTTNHSAYEYDWAINNTNVAINNQYLDFDSIKNPSNIIHTIYLGLSYKWDKCNYPTLIGIGTSFDFVKNNSELQNLTAWFKVGINL